MSWEQGALGTGVHPALGMCWDCGRTGVWDWDASGRGGIGVQDKDGLG